MICCPITSKVKNYPFEVLIPEGLPVNGAALGDHMKSLDWNARQIKFICRLPDSFVQDVLAKFHSIIAAELT